MTPSKRQTILVAGAGELGSRYLQSLATGSVPLDIHLLNNNPASLDVCEERWRQAAGVATEHRLIRHHDIEAIPSEIDLTVLSSSAEPRASLAEAISERSEVTYWVIEKILAQRPGDLRRLDAATRNAKGRWVNYYMLSQELYRIVKSQQAPGRPTGMRVFGGDWGLACNAMHFVHLHSWLNESQVVSISEEGVAEDWHRAKRPGHWELHGHLLSRLENGATLHLYAEPGPVRYRLLIDAGEYEWDIIEEMGLARRSDGLEVNCPVPYQSARTLLLDILRDGRCNLPTFDNVMGPDRMFIELMLDLWRRRGGSLADAVPIT